MKKIFRNKKRFSDSWIYVILKAITLLSFLLVMFNVIILLANLGIVK